MRVLLVGAGGREHALAWSLLKSPRTEHLYWAPGNGGCGGGVEAVPIKADDVAGLVAFANSHGVGLIVAGPEVPLVLGLSDRASEAGIPCFGPSAAAARLEGSKAFTKAFCERHGIPQGSYAAFSHAGAARDYLRSGAVRFPLVLKADGLAAGKGVLICQNLDEALDSSDRILSKHEFGSAGDTLLVEEFLEGEEASLLVFCDGKNTVAMPPARDFKRALDGDEGPNTGGMGAYCPAPRMTAGLMAEAMTAVIRPTLKGMAEGGSPFSGVLYAGLMLTDQGPKLLEFNCRFGDPETQVVLPRLESDLVEICLACAEGRLDPGQVRWKPDAVVTVVLASGGYPGSYATGKVIEGLDEAARVPGVMIFHAGTRWENGRLLTSGGRVLNVTALAPTLEEARMRAYEAVSKVHFEGMHFRKDIAKAR
jgi:phosphoribosylamine--glycine ligase